MLSFPSASRSFNEGHLKMLIQKERLNFNIEEVADAALTSCTTASL